MLKTKKEFRQMLNALMVKNLNKMILNDFSMEDFQLSISNIITPMMELMGQFVLSFVVNLDMMATRNGMFKSWFLRPAFDRRSVQILVIRVGLENHTPRIY